MISHVKEKHSHQVVVTSSLMRSWAVKVHVFRMMLLFCMPKTSIYENRINVYVTYILHIIEGVHFLPVLKVKVFTGVLHQIIKKHLCQGYFMYQSSQ